MLVLSRKNNEAIVFPDLGIEIRVVDIRGDKIRLGIDAPRDVDVWRNEVWKKIQAIAEQEAENTPKKQPA